MRVKLGL